MLSMIVILALLMVTVFLFIGRLAEVLVSKYRDRAPGLCEEKATPVTKEADVVDSRAA